MTAVLQKVNQVKDILKSMEQQLVDMDIDVAEKIELIQREINEVGIIVENHLQKEKEYTLLLKDVLNQMNSNELYNSLDNDTKTKMAEDVVNKPYINVLSETEFKEYVLDQLREYSERNLVLIVYPKSEIIKTGKTVLENATLVATYNAGLELLESLARTPTGFEEIVYKAYSRIISSTELSTSFLKQYHGLIK